MADQSLLTEDISKHILVKTAKVKSLRSKPELSKHGYEHSLRYENRPNGFIYIYNMSELKTVANLIEEHNKEEPIIARLGVLLLRCLYHRLVNYGMGISQYSEDIDEERREHEQVKEFGRRINKTLDTIRNVTPKFDIDTEIPAIEQCISAIQTEPKNQENVVLFAGDNEDFQKIVDSLEKKLIENNKLYDEITAQTGAESVTAMDGNNLKPEFQPASTPKEIGTLLEKARINAGSTQSGTAKKMGTDHRAVRRIEQGDSNPTWKTIQNFANANGYVAKVILESLDNNIG